MKLLKRLLPSPEHDAMLGDIVEESRRRSRLWYCGQLLAVLVVCSWKDIRTHKLLAVRATVTGLLVLPVFFYPASLLLWVVRVLSEGGYYVGPYWLTLPHMALIVTPFVFNMLGFCLSGWVVARFHRTHGFAMVLPYLLLVCLLPVAAITRLLADTGAGRSITGTTPLFVAAVLAILSLPACVVLGAVMGGLLGTKRARGGVS